VPELASSALTGGVLFHDALMHSPERLVLEVAEAASLAGAAVANHLELEGSLRSSGRITGARLRDRLSGGALEVRARRIVNAGGSWAPEVAARLLDRPSPASPGYSVAINFVTPGLGHDVAFTIAGGTPDPDRVMRSTNRQLFLVPWRGQTLIGTAHLPYSGNPAAFQISEDEIERFRTEITTATPSIALPRDRIALVHAGLLPIAAGGTSGGVRLLKRHKVHSHAEEGAPEVISVFSIKFTTARCLAEEVVDRVFREVGHTPPPCRTAETPLPGGDVADLNALRAEARRNYAGPEDILEHLVRTYGTRYEEVLAYRDELSDWDTRVVESAPVIRAQLLHGINAEMAATADDALRRRTELGPRGLITPEAERTAHELLAQAHAARVV
jgi:glycerol-3-phosphate dehydrogenase